jgi:hypothetical protein
MRGDKMKAYREAFANNDFKKADALLNESPLKHDKKSELLWQLEKGSVDAANENYDGSIPHFQAAIDLIDALYTKKLSSKAASFLINDASDVFYGASYERSFAYYYLAKSYYGRFLKSGSKLDLQGARAAILGWDTYFTELQRSATYKTLYHTDLMLKIFGGEVHEVSDIKNDKQIALQLYKDALKILELEGGIFSLFNTTSTDYIKLYETNLNSEKGPPTKFYSKTEAYSDLREFLQYKILLLTKEVRGFDFANQVKDLKAGPEIVKRVSEGNGNVVLILEEGLIPPKVGKPFNFGIRGAMDSVDNKSAKGLIATVGVEFVTVFAMNQLGLAPTNTAGPGSFIFAHDVTRLAVQEAAIQFELPMIENVPLVQRMELFVMDDKGVVVSHKNIPVISENGDIARVVLEEDVVARYVKTGTRVAVKHLVAIAAAIAVYQGVKAKTGSNGDFLAKAAAMGTYVGSTKGIAALEKADTRHWTTLPQALRMVELKLAPGKYQIGVAQYSGNVAPMVPSKVVGDITINKGAKSLHTIHFNSH